MFHSFIREWCLFPVDMVCLLQFAVLPTTPCCVTPIKFTHLHCMAPVGNWDWKCRQIYLGWGKSICKGPKVYQAVCLCMHLDVVQVRGVKSEWWHHLEQNGRIWWALSNVIKEGQWRVSAESSMRMMPLRSRGRRGGVVTFWELGRRDYTREKQVGRRREGIL